MAGSVVLAVFALRIVKTERPVKASKGCCCARVQKIAIAKQEADASNIAVFTMPSMKPLKNLP
jgi:hypothetical protein